MATTLPTDSPDPAAALPPWQQHLAAADWPAVAKQFQKKRTARRLAKATSPARQPLLWALHDNLTLETPPLVQRLQRWTAAAMERMSAAKSGSKSRGASAKGKAPKGAKRSQRTKGGKSSDAEPLDAKSRALLHQWLDEIGQRPIDMSSALESLAWARALPALASCLDEPLWGELFEALRGMAHHAGRMPFGQMPLSRQLLACELPLTLACLFDDFESDSLHTLGEEGLTCLANGMRELLDGEGMVHASSLVHQRSLLACWTRTFSMVRQTPSLHCEEDEAGQFEWLLRQVIRFTRHDGQQLLNGGRSGHWDDGLLAAAVALDDDPVDRRAAKLLPWKDAPKLKSKCKLNDLPLPGIYSDWAECGVMSAGWSPFDAKLAFAFPGRELTSEWDAAGRTWFDGEWTFELAVDGRELNLIDDLEELCWHEDEDVDYLELQARFENGWVVQRQVLLDRRHQFVFAGDAVLGPAAADVECRMSLPLAGAVKPAVERKTRELTLKARKTTIDLLPLALPEWRSAPAAGELLGDAERITLTQRSQADCLYMPLLIHLNPNRAQQLTWRQLTVAADLEIQPADAAAGYRVQFGEFQWLFYRSLKPGAPRTMLGQHLNQEFFAARLLPDGKTEELIAIEHPPH